MAEPLLLDGTLGRLARWLRLAGYDAAFIDSNVLDVYRAARHTGRLLLTRNTAFRLRSGISLLVIEAENITDQLAVVRTKVGPPADTGPRCVLCNSELFPIASEAVKGIVPPYVWRTAKAFSRCPTCHRTYWRGSHWNAIAGTLTSH